MSSPNHSRSKGAQSAEGKKRINSRRKGKDPKNGEPGLRKLLLDRDWQVFPRPRGEKGDDFTGIDPKGRTWSIECKNTVSLEKEHHDQCKENAKGNRILAWHPSCWSGFTAGSFLIFEWEVGCRPRVHLWEPKALCAVQESKHPCV